MVGKEHQKRKVGRKAEKRKTAEKKKQSGGGPDGDGGEVRCACARLLWGASCWGCVGGSVW